MTKQPSVVVVGCGKVGSRWDETDRRDAVLTHAGAWNRLGVLCALVDSDPVRLASAGRHWGIDALYTDYRTAFLETRPDIVSIATPTALRLPVVEAAFAAGARTLLLEKPVAATLEEVQAIRAAVDGAGAVVAVNYLRRYDPTLRTLAEEISTGCLGTIQHIVGRYGKGVLENGSHLIDLVQGWFGAVQRVQVLRCVQDDRLNQDPTLDAVLELGTIPFYLLAVDHRQYALFELDLVGTQGRITLTDRCASIERWEAMPDPLFPSYRVLRPREALHVDLGHALLRTAQEVRAVWRGEQSAPSCTLDDGIAALRTVLALREARHAVDGRMQVELGIPTPFKRKNPL